MDLVLERVELEGENLAQISASENEPSIAPGWAAVALALAAALVAFDR